MAFITQRGEAGPAAAAQLSELEALVSGVNQVSQSTLLLKKMKEDHEVEDALDYMKEQFARRMAACDERQRNFERKQEDMKDQVTRFEKFITENDSKRLRAEAKAKAERATYRAKVREQEKLSQDLVATEKERESLIAQLRRLRKYGRYLEMTVNEVEDADEVWDLLRRHTTLKRANNDLQAQNQSADQASDAMRMELQSLVAAHTNAVLVANSAIHADQKRVEEMRLVNKATGGAKERGEEEAKAATKTTGQVLLAIRNLYLRCVASMHSKVSLVAESGDGPAEQQAEAMDQSLRTVMERITVIPPTPIHPYLLRWQARQVLVGTPPDSGSSWAGGNN